MTIQLHNLKPAKGSRNKRKRLGRGNSSGKGTTAGRGTKGQSARTGGRNRRKMRGFRQIMLATPKLRGFKSNRPKMETVSLAAVVKEFSATDPVTPRALLQKGMIDTVKNGVKILGGTKAKLTKKLNVTGCAVTATAKKAIEDAGGEIK